VRGPNHSPVVVSVQPMDPVGIALKTSAQTFVAQHPPNPLRPTQARLYGTAAADESVAANPSHAARSAAIQAVISDARQAIQRVESFTGCGMRPLSM
jgi:hypothetical protein